MKYYKHKICIVTGGASGIGRSLCENLGRQGAVVVITDINLSGAESVAASINAAGGRAVARQLDVSKALEFQRLIEDAAAEFGRLDMIFNNAGIGIGGEVRDLELDHWRQVFAVNLWGVLHGSTVAYKLMLNQGFGHIVNMSSLTGLVPVPIQTAYSTSKSAVVAFSSALRAEGAGLGVKVSVICPGFLDTAFYDSAHLQKTDEDCKKKFYSKLPFKFMDCQKAAKLILRDVSHNRAIIVFPHYARFMWWLYRISPSLVVPISKKTISDFRCVRQE